MRKGPLENGENPSLKETSKTSNTENAIEEACELRFRWTRACPEDDHKLQISQGEQQTRTKKDDARMQWFELLTNDTIKLLPREPPLIVRQSILQPGLPTTTMRPVK